MLKKRFLFAYAWMFGTTKKEAEHVYRTADDGYIKSIIDSFEHNAAITFYEKGATHGTPQAYRICHIQS